MVSLPDEETTGKAGGFFLSMLGTLLLGIAAGLGIGGFVAKERLACVPIAGETTACQDILGVTGDMTMAAALGGVVVFGCGLGAIVLAFNGGESENV